MSIHIGDRIVGFDGIWGIGLWILGHGAEMGNDFVSLCAPGGDGSGENISGARLGGAGVENRRRGATRGFPVWKIVGGAPPGVFQRGKSSEGRHQGFSSVENRRWGATRGFPASKIVAGVPEGIFDEDLNNNLGIGENCCMRRGLPEVRRVGLAVLRSALRPSTFGSVF